MNNSISNISVIGAGTMGNGIAHVFAMNGYPVNLIDISEEALTSALKMITKNLDRMVAKGSISEEVKNTTLKNIKTTRDLESGVASSDLVIEAASENEDIKKNIFKSLDTFAPPHAILASNTSSISIGKIASVTLRPDKVIGMHFMNPVPIMKLVEIINGYSTSEETTKKITAITESIHKIPVEANDYPGFIANRILMPMLNEAIYALFEGVGGVKEIDTVMKLGMAHPMGPLQLADFIGLDVCKSIMDVLYEGFGNPKYAPCPLLVNMVVAGKLGKKSGEGFYNYTADTKEWQVSDTFSKR